MNPEASPNPQRNRNGLLVVYTGNGKGKTTAALGLLMRAWGRGMRGCVIQFIKAETGNWGEVKAARKMGIEWHKVGEGFTNLPADADESSVKVHQLQRQAYLEQVREKAAGLPRQPQVGGMVHRRHEAAGLHGWSLAQEKISCGDYDLIILDEFTYLLHFGWIDCADVLDWLRSNKPPNLHLVITGRYAPQELVEAADLVT